MPKTPMSKPETTPSRHRKAVKGSMWTDEENIILIVMTAKGYSASEIAVKLKGKSRCAVLGRIKRIRDRQTTMAAR